MHDTNSLFADFSDSEMIPVMKRAFDETSAIVHTWGSCGAVFTEDEAEAAIAEEILSLAEDGVRDGKALSAFVLARIGTSALNKVAQNIRPDAKPELDAMVH
jgi:hypothetical protein